MKSFSNCKGQATVEAVLISIVLVALVTIVSERFNAEQHFKELVQTPWTNRIAGMIENGSWGTVKATNAAHPNRLIRHSSIVGTNL